jgi:DNA-binding transcriptional regulator YiaG
MDEGKFWINPVLCNNCVGFYAEPQCVIQCPVDAPVPFQAKKGRTRLIDTRPATSPDLFLNGKNSPFASAIVIWEACNLLAQRQSLAWKEDEQGKLIYQRQVNQGRGSITLRIADTPDHPLAPITETLESAQAPQLQAFDIRAACLHLIYAAFAAAQEKPWEDAFVISDQQIEEYLGLDKRKDLTKPAKLTLIKELAQQPCYITSTIDWAQQGQIWGFHVDDSKLWELLDIQHHFQLDELGCKHLVGLTFKIRAGIWAKYFLNQQGYRTRSALYQYGTLPKSLLQTIMSIWQQHEGAARMMLWLLFKTRISNEQRVTVPTLMRIAYGETRVAQVASQREERKRLMRTFENDLSVLHNYGLKPAFDPVTYPPEIQPLWSKLADLPDDAEDALEFWMNDANNDTRLTDAGPRGKWNLLMNARILCFELPADWVQSSVSSGRKKQKTCRLPHSPSAQRSTKKIQPLLSGEEISVARKQLGWSQRCLAERTGKSQSWIRDIENGRFRAKAEDQVLLRRVLNLES